jgi:hypothetical protein
MKYFTFYRENNDFRDILQDVNLKKIINEKIKWYQHLTIGIDDPKDVNSSYITLKYGDEMRQDLVKDYSPVPGVDYIPKKDISKFKRDQ